MTCVISSINVDGPMDEFLAQIRSISMLTLLVPRIHHKKSEECDGIARDSKFVKHSGIAFCFYDLITGLISLRGC